jgi:hypothetical protein
MNQYPDEEVELPIMTTGLRNVQTMGEYEVGLLIIGPWKEVRPRLHLSMHTGHPACADDPEYVADLMHTPDPDVCYYLATGRMPDDS